MGMDGQLQILTPLPPGVRPSSLSIGGWVGLRAGMDGYGKSRPHCDSIPEPSKVWNEE